MKLTESNKRRESGWDTVTKIHGKRFSISIKWGQANAEFQTLSKKIKSLANTGVPRGPELYLNCPLRRRASIAHRYVGLQELLRLQSFFRQEVIGVSTASKRTVALVQQSFCCTICSDYACDLRRTGPWIPLAGMAMYWEKESWMRLARELATTTSRWFSPWTKLWEMSQQ